MEINLFFTVHQCLKVGTFYLIDKLLRFLVSKVFNHGSSKYVGVLKKYELLASYFMSFFFKLWNFDKRISILPTINSLFHVPFQMITIWKRTDSISRRMQLACNLIVWISQWVMVTYCQKFKESYLLYPWTRLWFLKLRPTNEVT